MVFNIIKQLGMVAGPDLGVAIFTVGGGFGPKASASNMEIAVCFLARRTGRPVRMLYTREQVFLRSRARHQFLHKMTIGVKNSGELVFLDHHCAMDGGAYTSFGIATIYYAGSLGDPRPDVV